MSETSGTISLANLLPHDSLSDKLWVDEQLKPEILSALNAIADKFYEFIGVPVNIIDAVITGSMANFNYAAISDIDIHVIIRFSDVDENIELVREFMRAKKSLWNDRHQIFIKGHEVELYVQDEEEQHYSTGVFSIKYNRWIKSPGQVYGKLDIDFRKIKDKTASLINRINRAAKKKDNEQLSGLRDKIIQMRKTGLEKGGVYSVENLVFKTLRRSGYIQHLLDTKRKIFDRSLSVDQ